MVVLLLVAAVAAVPLGTVAPGLPPVAGALPLVVELLVAAVAFVVASVLPLAPAPWAKAAPPISSEAASAAAMEIERFVVCVMECPLCGHVGKAVG